MAKTPVPAHLKNRLTQLRKRLRDAGAPALLVTHAADVRYLTNFVGDDSWLLVFASAGSPRLISDARFTEEIALDAPHVPLVLRKGPITDVAAELFRKHKLEKLALQAEHVTLAQRTALAKKIGKSHLMEFDDGLLRQRSVKDAIELKLIRTALSIQQEAYKSTLTQIQAGQSEMHIAAILEFEMKRRGADGPSFTTIVAADSRGSLPHARPTAAKVRRNSSLLIDWGARYQGYCSDLTRVVALGKMQPKIREIYKIVLEAEQAGIAAIAPGVQLADVDKAARQIIERAGFGPNFGHSLGHGIGMDVHEQPTLSPRSEGVLEEGQIVTVEPGIYLPGIGGVRIEDDVLVTRQGHEVLSDLPTALESAMI